MLFTPERFIAALDSTLRTLFPPKSRSVVRENPANKAPPVLLNHSEQRHVAGLMRVNHAGEVCAQALYQGQALTARLDKTRAQMNTAAQEEVDHLGWCEQRLQELSAQPSVLNPFWFGGSFVLGALAGLAGDKYSLGFVEETERQVSAHLQRHLQQLPAEDHRSKAIIEQMVSDEMNHAEQAHNAGAATLPETLRSLMTLMSQVMTRSSYYL